MANLIKERDNPDTTPAKKTKIEDDLIPTTNAAIAGWKKILDDYEDTNKKAVSSSLQNVGEWFAARVEEPKCFSRFIQFKEFSETSVEHTTQYKCDPPQVTPDITKECKEYPGIGTCEMSDEDIERIYEVNQVNLNQTTDWTPLPDDHGYYTLWAFGNPQIKTDSVSLVPKTWLDNTTELESSKVIMSKVPANVQAAMKSTGS